MVIVQEYFFVFCVVIFVSLAATAIITLLHKQSAFEPLHLLDFRTVAIELLTFTIWVKIFSMVFSGEGETSILARVALLILSIICGVFLIRNTLKESLLRKKISGTRDSQIEVGERIKQINKQRADFLSLTSHQFRGPYSSIKGYVSLLSEGEFGEIPEKMKDPIAKIKESTRALGFLLNDFLDVAKIEQGELDFDVVTTDATDLLDSALNDFTEAFSKNNISLVRSYDNKEDVLVRADPNRIQQALAKIIDNAIKYTPTGSVQVSLAVREHDAVITIKDTGIGIAEADVLDMFNKFTRAKNAGELSVHGNGLGLYIAKEMIESQDGKIWVESPGVGKGTTFYIALPLAK